MLPSLLPPLALAAVLLSGLVHGAQISDDSQLGLQSPRGNGATTHFVLTHKRSDSAPESPRRDTPPESEKPGHCRSDSLTPTALSRAGKKPLQRKKMRHDGQSFEIVTLLSTSNNHLNLALTKEGPVETNSNGEKLPSPKTTTVFWREQLSSCGSKIKAARDALCRGRRKGSDDECK